MKAFRFAVSAERSLQEIFDWSLESFGLDRAVRYQEDILATCRRIASNQAHTQSCTLLLSDGSDSRLRFARSGQHFIVFEELENLIGIVAVLHSSTDVAEKLASRSSWET